MGQEFLDKLESLCVEYNADFFYTTDDDGIHITLDGKEIYVGSVDSTSGLTSTRLCDEEG